MRAASSSVINASIEALVFLPPLHIRPNVSDPPSGKLDGGTDPTR
jgi:hypothetical protein